MVEKKTSVRSQDPGQRRVLDRAARQRRINRQLEALENDNFQDDPHAGLPQLGKRLPQFDDDADTGKKKKKTRGDHFKLRFRKNFQALLEEQVSEVDRVSLGFPGDEVSPPGLQKASPKGVRLPLKSFTHSPKLSFTCQGSSVLLPETVWQEVG
ncbi:PREDICTED: zinc finger HIT domain-containing protein 1 isoform X2 [Galeopterus variegatus]|uniref:Zinc finger HIT domain-containing protein 1 isoform X2 n=1 Tax=Galeopterus variegatus TaxID=482537 RepID=A0ABM0Q3L8_GALVR|nr:PREDICTED: zinc finger HIT domain-containing protein 1 isoform X2 [Galeopterus variegatus]XP_008590986.1 PREDICTED: zinc finger HIT domain-containing protein 1 isoform X2 [Galeopterus variegatus]